MYLLVYAARPSQRKSNIVTEPIASLRRCGGVAMLLAATAATALGEGDFRVLPYIQNPAPDGVTVLWFTSDQNPGSVAVHRRGANEAPTVVPSAPVLAEALTYPQWEVDTYLSGEAPAPPYRHRVRLAGLLPDTAYEYTVVQGTTSFSASFSTSPGPQASPVRLIFFADCEAEPESTGKRVDWTDPSGQQTSRLYLLDQTTGFANNLAVMAARAPGLISISGDVVESGGEQRDWDEFWRHVTAVGGTDNLAARVPLLAAPGNHEYYEGPAMDRYDQPGSERAISRFRSYFEFPSNGSPVPEAEGRYYRLDYGPVTIFGIDVSNDAPDQSDRDTNYYLLGQRDPGGGYSPGFGPGSRQYAWLEDQLGQAQERSAFTFVTFHHVPYSVGPHGWPAGIDRDAGYDPQSGVPVRVLTPLFIRYGVDAVIAGHDEIWERSEIRGTEILPGGGERAHTLHVLDVGTGGDGLRGPQSGLDNPYQVFLAHSDVPEVWQDGVLIEGGKHYGHLEVDVLRADRGDWQAVLKPVHVFPLFADAGATYLGYERRVYDDIVTLTRASAATVVTSTSSGQPEAFGLQVPYPNPFNSTVLLRYSLPTASSVRLEVYDALGRRVRALVNEEVAGGYHSVEWNARDESGAAAAAGVYLVSLRAGTLTDSTEVVLVK